MMTGGFAETVTASDGEDQWHCLVGVEKGGEFFGGKLLAAGVEQNEVVLLMTLSAGERQDCGFIFDGLAGDVGVAGDALEIFVGQRLNGGFFGFSDPDDFELHGCAKAYLKR